MQEILIEADDCRNSISLAMLWAEMVRNKYDYPLTHLWFAKEHINSLIENLDDVNETNLYLA